MKIHNINKMLFVTLSLFVAFASCKPKNSGDAISADAASKAYVAPGHYDEFYNFVSGGFSGQMSAYGLPSGRLLRVIPVFSVDPEKGYGFSEETKPMLNTSHGFIPWDDLHHVQLSKTNGEYDGKWEKLAKVLDTENTYSYNVDSGNKVRLIPEKWVTVGVYDLLVELE
jgi:nitrous-oxide reductase